MVRAEPVAIERHGRAIVGVLSIGTYERLRGVKSLRRRGRRLMPPNRVTVFGSGETPDTNALNRYMTGV
jgi:hypothetical protein